jgi:Plavaka transposase
LKRTGRPCDADGNYLPPGSPPLPFDDPPLDNWFPFSSRIEFETADFLFRRNQMSAGDIDTLFELWGASLLVSGGVPPFVNHKELYKTIDRATVGDIQWQSFTVSYDGPITVEEPPSWMTNDFEVWYRNPHEVIKSMLSNREFNGMLDSAPFREYDADGKRRYQNFMSGDWAWKQAVSLVSCYA